MAAAGYGTETTWESIFDVPAAKVDATRFGHMNVHIGRKFNFYITGDSETDITVTTITGMLAAETHELIHELYLEAKSSAVTNPWDFMAMKLNKIPFYRRYYQLMKRAQDILYGNMEIVKCDLPDANTRTY